MNSATTAPAKNTAAYRKARVPAILTKILNEVYGIAPLQADPTVIEWAVTRALESNDAETVKDDLRKLNKLRERHGRIPAYMPYGHPCF